MKLKEAILSLQHGDCYTVDESDYGKAEVYRLHRFYILFEIPQYGGMPMFHKAYHDYNLKDLIKEIELWT